MSTMRRKDLKPPRQLSDAAFLAGAAASATKAQPRLERERRREAAESEFVHLQRLNQGSQGPEGEANP